jgi:hypothetical protein
VNNLEKKEQKIRESKPTTSKREEKSETKSIFSDQVF